MGTFDDNRFKSESKKPAIQSIDIIGLGIGPEIEKKLKYAQDVCSGIILGKELVNAPANVLTPGLSYCLFYFDLICLLLLVHLLRRHSYC